LTRPLCITSGLYRSCSVRSGLRSRRSEIGAGRIGRFELVFPGKIDRICGQKFPAKLLFQLNSGSRAHQGVRNPFSLRLEEPLFEAIATPFLMARPIRPVVPSYQATEQTRCHSQEGIMSVVISTSRASEGRSYELEWAPSAEIKRAFEVDSTAQRLRWKLDCRLG